MKRFLTLLAFVLAAPLCQAVADSAPPVIAEMFSDEALQAVAADVVRDGMPPQPPQTRRKYWVTYAWLTASTIYDVESTFYLLKRCEECRETNPITRPFIDRGRLATYAYSAAVNAAVMYFARRMFDKGDTTWHVAPIAVSAVHGAAGTWNFYQAKSPPE